MLTTYICQFLMKISCNSIIECTLIIKVSSALACRQAGAVVMADTHVKRSLVSLMRMMNACWKYFQEPLLVVMTWSTCTRGTLLIVGHIRNCRPTKNRAVTVAPKNHLGSYLSARSGFRLSAMDSPKGKGFSSISGQTVSQDRCWWFRRLFLKLFTED